MNRRTSWLLAVGLAVLTVLLARSFFVVPYLPTNDGPEHVFASYLEAHYSDPGTVYADLLVPATEFASRGFTLLYGPLLDLLGWRVGLQIALALITVVYAFGFVTLVLSLDRARWPLAFLGFPLALTWELYMGFFPFMVGSAIGLYVLALVVRWEEPERWQRGVLSTMLLGQAICHVFTAVLTGLVIAVVVAPRGYRRGGLVGATRELGWALLTGLPACLVLVGSAIVGRSLTELPFAHTFQSLPFAETLVILPRLLAPGPPVRAIVATAVIALAALGSTASAFVPRSRLVDRSLAAAGAVFLVVGVVAPINVPGWQFFSPRFLPLGGLLCLAAVPVERWTRGASLVAASLVATASASWLLTSSTFHRRLRDAASDAIAALDAPVHRSGVWLPIVLAPEGRLSPYPELCEVPFLAPLRHIALLFAIAEGGMPPKLFAGNGATSSFVVRKGTHRVPPIPPDVTYAPLIESDAFLADAALRRRVVEELAAYGDPYEGVLMLEGRPSDVAILRRKGYVADYMNGSVFIGHFAQTGGTP